MAINITDDKNLEDIMEKISNATKESRQVYQIFLEHKHEDGRGKRWYG